MNKKDRVEVLFEDITGKFDRIIEICSALTDKTDGIDVRLQSVEEKVDYMYTRFPILTNVVKDHSSDVAELKAQAHSH